MVTVEDCILKADNYAVAAQGAKREESLIYIRLSAMWRNRALRLKLGDRARECLRPTPLVSDRLAQILFKTRTRRE